MIDASSPANLYQHSIRLTQHAQIYTFNRLFGGSHMGMRSFIRLSAPSTNYVCRRSNHCWAVPFGEVALPCAWILPDMLCPLDLACSTSSRILIRKQSKPNGMCTTMLTTLKDSSPLCLQYSPARRPSEP